MPSYRAQFSCHHLRAPINACPKQHCYVSPICTERVTGSPDKGAFITFDHNNYSGMSEFPSLMVTAFSI